LSYARVAHNASRPLAAGPPEGPRRRSSGSGGAGAVDEFLVNSDGSFSALGSVAGLGAGIEGIAAD
jgi:hypothetical protein